MFAANHRGHFNGDAVTVKNMLFRIHGLKKATVPIMETITVIVVHEGAHVTRTLDNCTCAFYYIRCWV
ncbi:unnamed protein product [Urochloa humidicola]